MSIAPLEDYDVPAREAVISEIMIVIDHAASTQRVIDPWTLAEEILEAIEPTINSVDPEGNVIYRI